MTALSVFAAALEAPEHPALIIGGVPVSYRDLAMRVAARLDTLRAATQPGVLTALLGTSDAPTLETLLALFELGVPVALIHPRLQPVEQARLLARLGLPRLLAVGASHPVPAPDIPAPAHHAPEAPLVVVFTSGTTAEPKGIELSRRAFLASATASTANLGWKSDDRWLLSLPLAHVGGLSVVTRCLIARRTVVIPEAVALGRSLGTEGLTEALSGPERVTLASLVPTQLELLLAASPPFEPPPHLRALLLGGAAARPALLEAAAARRVPVLTTYGLTEACSQVTTQLLGTVNRGELGAGMPVSGTEVRIEDGVIHVRGPTLFSRYVPQEPGESPPSANGWFRTTDLGRLGDGGQLFVLGRATDQIVTGGENVSPLEVELVLETHPDVAEACVFGLPDEIWGQTVAVALVLRPGRALDLATFTEWARGQLAAHRRPRHVTVLESLPTTQSGKVDRKAAAQMARAALASSSPRTPT